MAMTCSLSRRKLCDVISPEINELIVKFLDTKFEYQQIFSYIAEQKHRFHEL